jgi:tetratricopeptide (TPR) repeat protein
MSSRRRHAQNYYLLGCAHADAGAWDEAHRLLMRAVTYAPTEVRALHALANVLLSLGRPDEAKRYLTHALACAPTDIPSLMLRGTLALQEGNLVEAEAAFRAVHSQGATDPDPDLEYYLGLCALLAGRLEEAAACFERVVLEEPAHDRAWNALGCVRHQRQDGTGAVAAFLRALELNPAASDAREHLAQLWLEMGHAAQAYKLLEAGLTHDPQRPSMRRLLGMALAAQGNFTAAVAVWEALMSEDDESAELLHLLANGYLHQRRLEPAIATLRTLVARVPSHLPAHLQLGLLLLETGAVEDGWHHLFHAQQLDPHHPTVAHAFAAARKLTGPRA